MVKFIVKRLLWVIPVLLGASFLIFSLLHASPGDPAITSLGITATQEELDQFNEMHNLNDPLLVQYGKYIYNLAVKVTLADPTGPMTRFCQGFRTHGPPP